MVLVVDDDENLCLNLFDILQDKGYRVSYALDSITAIERVKTTVIDILLLDMNLPPLNGLETYLKIRDFNPKVVVVVITGFLSEMGDMVKMVKQNGAYALLEKPINIDNLFSILEQIEHKIGTTLFKIDN